MRSYLSFFLSLSLLSTVISAQNSPSWLRYPAVSPNGETIIFTYKDDLYRVSSDGGVAVPLTIHEAHDFMPVWSSDSRQIAFASNRYGNFDIFIIPAAGGNARRLTYHSADEFPYAFSPDNSSVFFGSVRLDSAENRLFPHRSQSELYSIPVPGGRVRQVLSTPAEEISFSGDGSLMLYQDKKGGENTWRKHHKSAIARDIWVYDTVAQTHRKITSFPGEDRNPIFTNRDREFYYLSEESGSFNVFKINLNGGNKQQVTSFQTHPVRFLSQSENGTLCFSYDGEIYTKRGRGNPEKVEITLVSDIKSNTEKVVPVKGGARELAVSPSGKEIAFVFRGDVFVVSVEGGITKRITRTPGQENGIDFSPDGKGIIYAAERNGRWGIYETRKSREEEPYFYISTILEEKPVVENANENYQPLYSPDGKEIAFIENRMTLKILNLDSRESRTLLTDRELFSMRDSDQYFQWSPDSKWILFDYSMPGFAPGEVGLISADGEGQVNNLTLSGFNDSRAKWILDGKAMIWYSNRDGLKSVAQSGGSQGDVYALFFTREAWDRFNLSKEEAALLKEQEEKEKKKEKKDAKEEEKKEESKEEKKVEDIQIEWDGLQLRKARLTIHSSSLGDALVSKDGETLYYLARFEKGMNLWTTNLRTKETKMLVTLNANRGRLVWDKEQKNMFLLSNGAISKIEPEKGKQTRISIDGEMQVDTAAERREMFEHVWNKTKNTFYTEGFHGADWAGLKPAYEKFLPHINNNFEFSEMLSELLGELNVSHSGARYGGSNSEDDKTASLGIFYDYSYQGDGIKITEVIQGGPLDKAGMDIRPGMIIESIDGESIAADRDLSEFLNRKEEKPTLLVIADGESQQEFTVKPVSQRDESSLLYDRWVRTNREEVDRLSNGKLGYIHVPGMNDRAYRDTFEEVLGRFANREGIVVDTRFNGGGDLVADLAMFLSGEKFFDYTTDTRSNGYEPNFRWTKPSIALANESNYSDGHCFAYSYQALELGKLVGMPVPGTCTFAGWEALQDSGIRWGVPPLGVKNRQGEYLENRQTEPDILLMNEYDIVITGKDQQLEAAVSALLEEIGG
jgi:Tol biopolymer transport system component/C-terminal processing protease CtpA/Prc